MSNVAFENFDDATVFKKALSHTKSFSSLNFVLDFNTASARYAADVDEDGIRQLLAERKPTMESGPKPQTRWINIWKPEEQKTVLLALGKHYGFSPRLLASMTATPVVARPAQKPAPSHRSYQEFYQDMMGRTNRNRKTKLSGTNANSNAYLSPDVESIDSPTSMYTSTPLDFNHYRIVNEVWHFASVDWGYGFTCIGYNSLYQMPKKDVMDRSQFETNKPAGKRAWTWLIICDDNTVISIHENPYPGEPHHTQAELMAVRHNMINVFRQLSKATEHDSSQKGIMMVHVRPGLQNSERGETHISEGDSASLLFYYLFDDWYTSYNLVARSEHQYGSHLERTRDNMFRVADLKNIKHLHHFGRQLAILKRIYQSYNMIIERVLRGPHPSNGDPDATDAMTETAHSALSLREIGPVYGMKVTTAAAVRFERLRDRVNLYALSEIQDCLDEKEALVMINFNLIALRESSYVERLTRVTILLAKVTILFIPVSLMSTYFTVPINGVNADTGYSLSAYWVSFSVILCVSFVVLVIFGQLSDTQEGKPIYQSLTKVIYHSWRRFFGMEAADDEKKAMK